MGVVIDYVRDDLSDNSFIYGLTKRTTISSINDPNSSDFFPNKKLLFINSAFN